MGKMRLTFVVLMYLIMGVGELAVLIGGISIYPALFGIIRWRTVGLISYWGIVLTFIGLTPFWFFEKLDVWR